MASSTSTPMTFYDIAMASPVAETACSPNPWKSRYALNFKGVPYKTNWVPFLDVPSVRGALNIPVSRKYADGTPYHTLPVLSDPSTGCIVGDSFEIATYLQEKYPSSGAGDLFPAQELDYVFGEELILNTPITEAKTTGEIFKTYVEFNTNVDTAFTAHVQLMMDGMRLEPLEGCRAEFSRRANGIPWEHMRVSDENRSDLFKSFEQTLGGIATLFLRDESGPFLMGQRPSYADLIVGGWLRMCRVTLPREEWEAMKKWHKGVFGRLDEALQVFAQTN